MNVENITSLATSMAATRTREAVDVTILKKAIDIQKNNAAALLAAMPVPAMPNLPSHLGQTINTIA